MAAANNDDIERVGLRDHPAFLSRERQTRKRNLESWLFHMKRCGQHRAA
jgi:hypothetical protein